VSLGEWRYVAASVVGSAHLARAGCCQDASDCRVIARADAPPVLVAVVADGAGSAERGEVGARLACAIVQREVVAFLEAGRLVGELTRDHVGEWLRRFADEIRDVAEVEERAPRDYACTLLGAIVDRDQAAFFQIGDGAMVVSDSPDPDALTVVFWPQRGEYANQTFFASDDDASEQAEFAVFDRPIDEVALLTDGLQGLALRYAERAAHARFFGPVFAAVRQEPPGESAQLTQALITFLGSDRLNERTDDDKTLVLATRRAVSG
jgi:hypothetical protein